VRVTFADELVRLADADERVVFVGSDLGHGAMEEFRGRFPDRFFMEGVSEQYVVGMAAGLAMDGYVPFVVSLAGFITRRSYEQLRIDLGLHRLPVRVVGLGGGLVYAPLGPTHLATEDWSLLRAIPGMTVLAPGDRAEVRALLAQAVDLPGPVYLRLGPAGPADLPSTGPTLLGTARLLRPARDVLIVSAGPLSATALAAAAQLEILGVAAGVLHVSCLAPFDLTTFAAAVSGCALVVSLEEHSTVGGLGSILSEALAQRPGDAPLLRLGIPERFSTGSHDREELLRAYGLDAPSVAQAVQLRLGDGGLGPVQAGRRTRTSERT
jgi:transketolase